MKRILFIIIVTLITLAIFTFFSNSNNAEAHEEHEHEEEIDFDNIPITQQQFKTVNMRLGKMESRELDAVLNVNGQLVLRAQNIGDVNSLMGGIVKEVFVKEGQYVSKGQTVANLENTEVVSLQRDYFTAYKEAEIAFTEMQRQKTLQQNGAGVKKTLQQSEKNYKVAQATIIGIGRQLQQMGINPKTVAQGKFTTMFPVHAPITGTVSQITTRMGAYADMQTPLMKIRNNEAVEADLYIFERDLSKVKKGNRVLLTLTNQKGIKVSGTIYSINKYFNEGTKTVAAHVRLDTTKGQNLFDSMYVQGQIATGRQMCNAVPSKAIITTDNKQYVFLLNGTDKNGKYSFSRHEITTGVSQNGYTEISPCEHITNNRQLVVDNAFYLASMTGEHGEHNH